MPGAPPPPPSTQLPPAAAAAAASSSASSATAAAGSAAAAGGAAKAPAVLPSDLGSQVAGVVNAAAEAQGWTTVERAQTLMEQWVVAADKKNWVLALSKDDQGVFEAACAAMRMFCKSNSSPESLQGVRKKMSPAACALFENIKSETPAPARDSDTEASASEGGPKTKRRRTPAAGGAGGRGNAGASDWFLPKLVGKTVVIFIDFQFEDLEVMYPKIRLEEEGAKVIVCGIHDAPMKYTGKYGYPVMSDISVKNLDVSSVDGLVLPGGFAPDFMRRSQRMLEVIVELNSKRVPIAAICHGGWMLCSARQPNGKPVICGKNATGFVAVRDDLINAGAYWADAPVVVDGNIVTSRTPQDLTPFCCAMIKLVALTVRIR